jgi:formamidopyrimidine-DNA glycosylase
MPELPEVETTLRGVSAHVLNSPICRVTIRNPSLRWPVPAQLGNHILNHPINKIERRAKYLLLQINQGTVIIHLGMSGSLRITLVDDAYDKHDHVEFCFKNGKALRLKDPRRFGAVLWEPGPVYLHPLLKQLGPEPLSDAFNPKYLYQRSRNKKQAVKQFIMDSKVVVGVGNIYANESLFASGIHPARAAGRISLQRYQILCQEIKRILQQAIEQGGTTLKDFISGTGKPGYFKQELLVYGRKDESCVNCGRPLKESRLGNRSTIYCSYCQK